MFNSLFCFQDIFFKQLLLFLNPLFRLIFYALMFSYRHFVIENVFLVLNSKLKILSTYYLSSFYISCNFHFSWGFLNFFLQIFPPNLTAFSLIYNFDTTSLLF